jgi:hypothetical protein
VRQFIKQKLQAVMADFQSSKTDAGCLCECKQVTYEAGNSPDYSNPQVQQAYMLRFFPAYLAEYFLMYRRLLRADFLQGPLRVLSIGCGSGIDLWGLKFAVEDSGIDPAEQIEYTGVDLASWAYRDDLGLPVVRFLQQDITDWQQLDRTNYNVFIFPKCIGEFPTDVFQNIRAMFSASAFDSDRICGLCSLMNLGLDHDIDRFTSIAGVMQRPLGFQCLDDAQVYRHYPKTPALNQVCSGFDYPDDILQEVKSLADQCPKRIANGASCEEDCEKALNRWPILKTTYVKYQMLRFQR